MLNLKKQITGLMQTTVVVFVLFSLCGNKLFAQGMGIGTSTPASVLDVEGNVAIGASYSGTTAAPTNGLIVEGNVGIGTSAPLNVFNIKSTNDALTGVGTPSNYFLFLHDAAAINGKGVGIGFANTSLTNTVGAAIIFKRTGANAQGELQFYTKTSTTGGVAPVQAMVIDNAQNIGIGTAGPAARLHLYEATGTTLSASAGTLILEHGNSGGESSILFKSNVSVGGDYGYIKYSDDGSANGTTNDNSLLEIGVQNDVYGSGYDDDIALMPSSHVGIGTRGPKSMLDVNGNLTVGSTYSGVTAAPADGAIIKGHVGIGTTAPVTNAILAVKDGHLQSQQTTAPTVAATNAGTTPTVSLSNATDIAGLITFTTGTGAPGTGAYVTVTFNKTYTTAPMVLLYPNGPNAAQDIASKGIYVTSTTSTFVINFNVAAAISTQYKWFYHVILEFP